MTKVKSIKKTKQYLWGSLIALLFPCYIILLWIYVVETTAGPQRVLQEQFYSYFPCFLQQSIYLEVLAILCCTAAFVFGFKALPTRKKWHQAVVLCIMGIAALLGVWFLFSLM